MGITATLTDMQKTLTPCRVDIECHRKLEDSAMPTAVVSQAVRAFQNPHQSTYIENAKSEESSAKFARNPNLLGKSFQIFLETFKSNCLVSHDHKDWRKNI